MKVAVIGSGGREHALAWKLAQSKTVEKLYAIPGSAAMAEIAECIDIPVSDLEKLPYTAAAKESTCSSSVRKFL